MNYTKPEVSTLGEAATVIELITGKNPVNPVEGPPAHRVSSAYDLDE